MPERAWKVTAGAILVVLAALITWVVIDFRQHQPLRIEACDRTYGHTPGAEGGGPFSLAELRRQDPRLQIVGQSGDRNIWGVRNSNDAGRPACGLGVYLEEDDGVSVGYGLIGGP